ncbi:MAG: 23S rRNA (pseudouridine(1915)-N(3))-methyltransferase RlmH [Cohaesibacter sp.]|nr:23S rRNA (pseudouridine(1915)-N(3))-methyltransferase RlmH [Cohaesibacter sp.]MCV6601596.1 23S rRNA (pseudouridine(1915)-N(3))-methyltransferase RlmH [Cohaesibacter sp.]
MKLILAAVGRQKAGPETDLLERYLDRARKAGRSLGFTSIDMIELVESRAKSTKARKDQEAEQLLKALPANSFIIALDEHGKNFSSPEFAALLDRQRSAGHGAIALVIGGPDGHGKALLLAARSKLALGTMTWPHQIARMLIAEQLYRAMTILTGHPYHRS